MTALRGCLLASVALLGGCYQTVGLGYTHRFAEAGGDSFEGHYLMGFGNVIGDDEPVAFAKIGVAGGPWGMRAADVLGVMAMQDLGDVAFFLRPGLAFLVLGAEARPGDDALWFGIGAELGLGFVIPLGDANAIEIGVHSAGDLGYTGDGTGASVGVFLGYAWDAKGPQLYTR